VRDFEDKTGNKAEIAWNGGFILNPELVGKLGLPESYIGAPLGLLISEGECLSPPLFNKAALLIDKNGRIDIRRVQCSGGIDMKFRNREVQFTKEGYNNNSPGEKAPAYYDLMYHEKIPGNGRVIIRFSGKTVREVIYTMPGEDKEIIPVGLTISLPANTDLQIPEPGEKVEMKICDLQDIRHAIEAGPLLLSGGKVAIGMEEEGWNSEHSISTQAARLDYLDMRGPKIAAGINEKGEFMVLTINGRIRESVGATHNDMARILATHGIKEAMGFDPGGSSTLFSNGKTLNISPYNRNYEYNVYALPPEPRAVSNAIIGYIKR